MKKVLKKILGFVALVLIIAGVLVLMWQYFRNKQLFVVLMNNSIVKGSLTVLQKMALAVLAIIVGLILQNRFHHRNRLTHLGLSQSMVISPRWIKTAYPTLSPFEIQPSGRRLASPMVCARSPSSL